MILIEGEKYACAQCIRGHRSSICRHTTRPLLQVRSRGRPVSKCNHRVVVDNEESPADTPNNCCPSEHSPGSEDPVISLKGCKKEVYNVSASGSLRILNPVRLAGNKVGKPGQRCPCTKAPIEPDCYNFDSIESVIHKLFSSSAPKNLCACLEGSCTCQNPKVEGNLESMGEMEMRLIDLPRENGHFQVKPHDLLETCRCDPGNCKCDDCSHNLPNFDMLSTESFLNSLDNDDSCTCADEDCNCETCFKHGKFDDIELFR